jgi:hypothetical protein
MLGALRRKEGGRGHHPARRVTLVAGAAIIVAMVFASGCDSQEITTTPLGHHYGDFLIVVTAPGGAFVSGAEVTVQYLGHLDADVIRRTRQGTSDANGEYRLRQPESSIDDPPGYSQVRVLVDPPVGASLASASVRDSIWFQESYRPPISVIPVQLDDTLEDE